MTTQETIRKLDSVTHHYLEELDRFSMEDLTRKPSEEEWSLGQMYMHLVHASLYMHLRNVRACAASADEVLTEGEKSERGEAAFANQAFPPVRIQVPPSPAYTPPQPDNKEQLREGLRSVLAEMRKAEPLARTAPVQNKLIHPGFGALNAAEWFMLVEMHYRHHLRQKERLESFIEGAGC
ncbi:DinB family protein [Paenibacillus sp. HJL G12]|uniref:DinB family protein n=1 Tax=Paenibacillus dendrobii TaxID=2691084 RepID=A0A7X3ILW2_9BACL|nr:DinB family protein [Paenibacillus dendrobii]MWV46368.1 DinB family protein [Paenibacillus dendrobii]